MLLTLRPEWICLIILSPAALSELPDGCSATPLAERQPRVDGPGFVARASEEIGIDFRHTWNPPRKYFSLIDGAFVGGGVAIGDVDGDGRPDIYLSRPFGGGQLYRNLGNWKFENITTEAGLGPDAFLWGSGCTMADIDNDGDLDLSICGYEKTAFS